MKLYTEISPDVQDEIIIRCKEHTDEIKQIERLIASIISGAGELKLYLNNADYYIPKSQILFFETCDGKIAAHTATHMFYTDLKLFELEKLLPVEFVRISKSAIVNIKPIISIAREITGASEIRFKNCAKKVYCSRNYYKILKEKIEEIRLKI